MTIQMQLYQQNWIKLHHSQIQYASSCPLASTTEADVFLAQKIQGNAATPLMALKLYKGSQKPSQIIQNLIGYNFENVIHFYEVRESNSPYCLMQLCGKDLRESSINTDPVYKYQQILQIARQVVNGMIELKQLRLIHGDIKPQNLLMSLQGKVKICDLDFAVTEKHASEKRLRVGTFQYMAPQVMLQGRCSYKSDTWSLGVVIYELYFGNHPFPNLFRLNSEDQDSFKSGYNIISRDLNQLRNTLTKIRENSQSQTVIQLINILLYTLSFNFDQRRGLEQLAVLLSKNNKVRKMSEIINNTHNQKHKCLQLHNNRTLIQIFQNLLNDIKLLPKNDILFKKAKELHVNLEQLINCMYSQNETTKYDFQALLEKFSLQSRKVSGIIENNLKRLGRGSQRLAHYQQKISLAQHIQLANSFLNKQNHRQKNMLGKGFHSAEELPTNI